MVDTGENEMKTREIVGAVDIIKQKNIKPIITYQMKSTTAKPELRLLMIFKEISLFFTFLLF